MLDDNDKALIEHAKEIIKSRYKEDWHVVGSALRLKDGRVYTGVHLEAYIGRIAVCAEAVALGRAFTEAGNSQIDTIVAVRHPSPNEESQEIKVVSPCGMCRELISDYSSDAMVIIPDKDGKLSKVSIAALLPQKYVRG